MYTTANIDQLNEALSVINKKYKDNIIFNRLEQMSSNRVCFTLKVKDSNEPGARRGTTGRRLINACWHVHGDFFDALFDIDDSNTIVSMGKFINVDGGNWEDKNIGSGMNPMYYSEACEC
jgi:hypothetical protein